MTVTKHNTKTAAKAKVPPFVCTPGSHTGKLVQQAYDLKNQIAALEEQLEPLKERLTKFFVRKNGAHLRIDCGDAQICWKIRHHWTYSKKLQNELLRVALLCEQEQQSGVAKDAPTRSVSIGSRSTRAAAAVSGARSANRFG